MLIYKITHKATGKTYVGQTRQPFNRRLIGHLRSSSLLIEQALNDEGVDAFDFEIIEECNSIEQLNERERYWISALDTLYPNGYNKSPGGYGEGRNRVRSSHTFYRRGRKHYYPAVFEPMDNDPNGYVLTVPDVAGCVTQGYTLDEAMYMAHDAIGTMLEDVAEADYPAASAVNDIDLSGYEAGAFVSLVCFDKEKWDRETSGIEGARQAAGLSIKGLADLLGAPSNGARLVSREEDAAGVVAEAGGGGDREEPLT